jgi:N-acetylglucosaminyldiphosphoundecaprenol N-acetyl-beta-D-mannosaminyltransferase
MGTRRLTVTDPPSSKGRAGDVCELYNVPFHLLASDAVLDRILERDPSEPFAYVVSPNVDHIVRVHASGGDAKRYYDEAWLSVCDSAPISILARIARQRLPLVAGSDLVEALFARLDRSDRLLIVGCEPRDVDALRRRFALTAVAHYNPPMGFIDDPAEVQRCVDFVVAHPARLVFLAVGSPQQEIVANRLRHCGKATGLGLCVGSSLRFLSGAERRAPRYLRGSGFEWLFRLAQDPRRLSRRYLVQDLAIVRIAVRYALASALEARSGAVARSSQPPRRWPRAH